MADEKENKVGSARSTPTAAGAKVVKKLDDVKDSPENKAAIAEAEGKTTEDKTEVAKEVVEDIKEAAEKEKEESKPAVARESKKEKKSDSKIELEREYVIPLKRTVLKAPQYRRAKKAIKAIRDFVVRHMRVENRDTRKVKIDTYLNNEIWFRGIKKPMNKVKVIAKKNSDGIVTVELAEIPEKVKFDMARDEKKKAEAANVKSKLPKKAKEEVDKDGDGVADKVEEKEDKKSNEAAGAKKQKEAANTMKHTSKGAHAKKTMPVRKALKA